MKNNLLLILCISQTIFLFSNPLHDAIKAGNVTQLKKLLKTCKRYQIYEVLVEPSEDDTDDTDDELVTPFGLAIKLDKYDCMQAFLDLPAFHIDHTPIGFDTPPLWAACFFGDLKLVKMLINAGVDIHACDNAITSVSSTNSLQAASMLTHLSVDLGDEKRTADDLTVIHDNYLGIINLLIKSGLKPNKKKTFGGWVDYEHEKSPLYEVVTAGNYPKIVKALVDATKEDDASIKQAVLLKVLSSEEADDASDGATSTEISMTE